VPQVAYIKLWLEDWVVGFDINGNGTVEDTITIGGTTYREQTVVAKDLGRIINLSRTNAGLASADTNSTASLPVMNSTG
jgi:hypothetical protein